MKMKISTILISLLLISELSLMKAQNNLVERYETILNITPPGKLEINRYYEIIIYNKKGENLTQIEIPFNKSNPVTDIDARIVDMSGKTLRKLKQNEIIDKSDISDMSLFEDHYVKSFDLKHNIYPYKIIYGYKVTLNEFVNIINWFPVVDLNTTTKISTLKLTVPNSYKIDFFTQGITDQKIDTFETTTLYTFTSNYTTIIKTELFSQPVNERLPYIIIIPKEFYYGVSGQLDSWKSFGDWFYKLNSDLNDLTQNEKDAVNQLLKGIVSDEEKIQTLYKYLQSNTRYVNVSIETGGLKSYPASYVCTNKFGDCKALSTYMKSLLEYVGIKSYYSIVNAGENSSQIITEFPSSQFNHVILCIPLKKDTIWLDPTLSFAPLGYLGTFTQNRYALVVEQNNSKLLKTPTLGINDVKEYYTYRIFPEEDNGTNLKMHFDLKGDAFEKVSSIHKSFTEKEKEEFLREFIPLKNYQLNNWKIYQNPSDHSSIMVDLDITVNNYLKSYNNFKYTNLMPLNIPNFEKPEKRKTSIRLNFPIFIEDKHIFETHLGYHFQQFNDTSVTTPFGIYALRSEINDNRLNIDRQLIIYAGEYALSEYQSFYDFINKIKYIEKKKTIVITQNK